MKIGKILFIIFTFIMVILPINVKLKAATDDFSNKTAAEGSYYYYLDVHEVKSVPQITEEIQLEANDEYDGILTNDIQYDDLDNYEGLVYNREIRERELGTYRIKYTVSDNSNNISELMLYIVVEDNEAPYCLETSILRYELDIDNITLTTKDILQNIHLEDRYYESDLLSYSISNTAIETLAKEIDIEQIIPVTIEDESENRDTVNVIVVLKDQTSPTITLDNTTVTTTYYAKSSLNLILDKLNIAVSDNYDTQVTYEVITDNYSSNMNIVGEYEVIIESVDSSDNSTIETITINVVDDIPPVFYIDESKVFVKPDVLLAQDDFVSLLRRSNKIKDDDFECVVLEDTYTESADVVGEYVYSFRIVYDEEDYSEHKFIVNVVEDDIIVLTTWQKFLVVNQKIGLFVYKILLWPISKIMELI